MEIKQMQRNRISTTEIDSNTCRNLMYDKEDNQNYWGKKNGLINIVITTIQVFANKNKICIQE